MPVVDGNELRLVKRLEAEFFTPGKNLVAVADDDEIDHIRLQQVVRGGDDAVILSFWQHNRLLVFLRTCEQIVLEREWCGRRYERCVKHVEE